MTISELDADIDFLCSSTSATYSPTSKRRNMNIAYRDIARKIWEVDSGWTYDDTNATTRPHAYTDLVNNQQDYTLPSTAQVIDRVEVLDPNGNYIKLNPFDKSEFQHGVEEFLGGNVGLPLYYELQGRSLLLYPTPSSAYATLTNGLHIWVDRDITEFAVSATTSEPGFAAPFHRILSYACAIDFTQDPNQRQFWANQKLVMEQALVRFYSRRANEVKAKIKPAQKRRWRSYT